MHTVTVLVASNNAHKLQELREIFAMAGASDVVRLITPRDLGLSLDPEENADTYVGNAQIKARAFAAALLPSLSGEGEGVGWVLSDDSGLEVDALGGRPGLHSARYHKNAPGGDGCAALLREMAAVPQAQRSARFRCVLVLVSPSGAEHVFEGVCEGRTGREKRGEGGFGFDPVFDVGDGRTMAELTAQAKHLISHRGVAARKVADFLVRNP